MRKGRRDSRSGEESSSRVSAGRPLKKGPWTSDEDAILIAYVQKHGEGNWNAVQKHSGLSRCGKSCRLRWANHLRPDLKKGAFTQEEERRIIELHAIMGNKWARMAGELPGRTDNEIKNFWNTRLKRLQRAGLPIYPDEVRRQVMNAAQNGQNIDALANGDAHGQDSLQTDNFEIPEVEFKHLELNQSFLTYPSMLLDDVPSSSMLKQGIIGPPDTYNLMAPPSMPSRKRLRESETLFSVMDGYATNDAHFVNYAYEKTGGDPLAIYPSCTSDLNTPQQSSQLNVLPGSQPLGNATYTSSSEPLIPGATKLELPSLQYLDSQHAGGWETPSNPMPGLESVDTLIQSPLTDQTQSDCPSSQNNGLLESVLYESQMLNSSTKLVDSSGTRWKTNTDSIPPLVQFSSSVITPISGSSSGFSSKFEPNFTELELNPSVKREEIPELIDLGWFSSSNSNEKYKCLHGDLIRELLGEDLSSY